MASSPAGGPGLGGSGSAGSGFGGSASPRRGAGRRKRSLPGEKGGGGAAAARLALERAQERKALDLFHQSRLVEAEAAYRQLISAGSRNPEVYLNLAAIFWLTNRAQAAVEPLQTAIALDPSNPEAFATLGTALHATGDLAGAVAAHRHALELRPEFVEAMVSLGNALVGLGEHDKALSQFNAALARDPQCVGAHVTRGALRLSRGEFSEGWKDFEWRWLSPELLGTELRTGQPRWQPGEGHRRLLVWAEQGLGDEILFASMLAEAQELADDLLVQVDPRLITLMERSLPGITFYDRRQKVPETLYDAHLPMGSLGSFLRPDAASFPLDRRSYLMPDQERSRDLRQRLGGGTAPICGISWRSYAPRGTAKSVDVEALAKALLRFNPFRRLVSLQYGPIQEEVLELREKSGIHIETLEGLDPTNDLDGLAALIGSCDEVVSISNATAHLAGALGATSRVLVTRGDHTDGRWPAQTDSTPWYPSIKLIPQKRTGSWSEALQSLATEG